MGLVENLYDLFHVRARALKVAHLCAGLQYTAVVTDAGGTGIAYTNTEGGGCCPKGEGYRDYEGESAAELLALIKSPVPLERSMALALINAINHEAAGKMPEEPRDSGWMDSLGIGEKSRVAMVGLFGPLMKPLQERGALVEVIERNVRHSQTADFGSPRIFSGGEKSLFYDRLAEWAEVLVLTSTSILNGTAEEVLSNIGPEVKAILLGPSTPMAPEAFAGLPVRMLGGTVVEDGEAVLRAVRHGAGTPVIHRFSRKVLMTVRPDGVGPDRQALRTERV
ncbi:MAG: Rossmann-like domain-containing protein [Syntrophobacteraceae bacterium]